MSKNEPEDLGAEELRARVLEAAERGERVHVPVPEPEFDEFDDASWANPLDVLAASAVDIEALEDANEESRRSRVRVRDARICTCGHPMSRHHYARDQLICRPLSIVCRCKYAVAVLEAEDVRKFIRTTRQPGYGPVHALSLGLIGCSEGKVVRGPKPRNAEEREKRLAEQTRTEPIRVRWLERGKLCFNPDCDAPEGTPLMPVGVLAPNNLVPVLSDPPCTGLYCVPCADAILSRVV